MEWIKSIAAFLIFTSLVRQLVPNKKYEPYVRIYVGLALIVLVMEPLLRAGGMEKLLDLHFLEETYQAQAKGAGEELRAFSGRGEKDVTTGYKNSISLTLDAIFLEKGYELQDVEVELVGDESSLQYACPSRIRAYVRRKDGAGVTEEAWEAQLLEAKAQIGETFLLEEDGIEIEVVW